MRRHRLSSDSKMLDVDSLNDLEMPFYVKISFHRRIGLTIDFSALLSRTSVKTNEDTPILAATKMFAGTLSFVAVCYKVYSDIYTLCLKKTRHLIFYHNFGKYEPIFKILSLPYS